jgi:predicted permease
VNGGPATVAGLVLSQAGVRLFERAIADTGAPSWFDFSLDLRVFTFLALVCGVTTVLFGLLPALYTTRPHLVAVIGQASRGSAAVPGRRWSDVLVVAQFALTLTLLMSAGLVVRELGALRGMQVGVDTAGVTVMQVELPRQQYATPEARLAFYARLDQRLERLPDARATYATTAPATGAGDQWLGLDGRPASEARNRRVSHMVIGPRYFATLVASPVRGRTFKAVERGDTVVINQRLAQLYFADRDPIGMRIRFEQWRADIPASPWFTIVGVAPDIRQRSTGNRPVDPVVYTPYGHSGDAMPFATLIVRSSRPVADIAARMRALVRGLDPSLPVFDVRSLDDALVQARWATRLFGIMFSIVAAMAVLLASVGLYALTAYSVSLRTREIGVRMALGGRNRQIWWTIGRRGLAQAGVGLLVGTGGALVMGLVLRDMLPSAAGATATTLVAVASLLVLVAVTACFVPARRALQLNPVDALRGE